ncbi:MAG: hypothetical protein ACI4F4_03495 [Lachnospiraceae bacterium]
MGKYIYKLGKFFYFFVLVMVVCSLNVYAYIDPSTVTYFVQAIAGILIAIGAALTVYRHKIIAFFKGKKKSDEDTERINKSEDLEDKDGVVDIQLDEE